MSYDLCESARKAIVYLRASKKDCRGADIAGTIYRQGKHAAIYCEEHGLQVVEVVVDEDVSGEIPFFERKGGRRVLELLRASKPKASTLKKGQRIGAPGHLVTASVNRLGRNVNDITTWIPEIRDAGITLHLTEQGGRQNLHDYQIMLILQVMVIMAEHQARQ